MGQSHAFSPTWTDWAFEFGYQLRKRTSEFLSNLIVCTTPCQSPLSAVISFGFLVGELEDQIGMCDANTYFEYLYSLPADTLVKMNASNAAKPNVYKLTAERIPREHIIIKQVSGRLRRRHADAKVFLTRSSSLNYVVDRGNEEALKGLDALLNYPAAILAERISENIPVDQNWRANLTSIVIAGPTGGHCSPRSQFESAFFALNDEVRFSLAEILAVKEWKSPQDQTPHYSHFFNSSSRKQGDATGTLANAKLAVFTSVDSFLRFSEQFQKQIQVVVLPRDIDASRMERFDAAIRRHMERADLLTCNQLARFPQPPTGIQLFCCGASKRKEKKWR